MKIERIDTEDLPTNTSRNEHFQTIVQRAVDRRGFLKFGSGAAVATFLAGPLAACGGSSTSAAPLLGFKAVAMSTADTVVVPEGYTATPFVPWGTPLFSTGPGSSWSGTGSETAADQARQVGDNHDGIHFFPIDGSSSTEGLLVMNHEYNTTLAPAYTDYLTLFGPTPAPANTLERVNKAINTWGCSVIHIKKNVGNWSVVLDSVYNRRITAATPMLLTGPAAGDDKLKTSADLSGTEVLGTINNCGNGHTPWGTYLTCEENFNNNFGTNDTSSDTRTLAMKRYGITAGTSGYAWETRHTRFDYKLEPNESNRFGWIVEIDPFDPASKPKKRTALGRFKHENAAYAFTKDKRVVIYMGDDQADDYIYKFVSTNAYVEGNQRANATLLDSGKLYVAKFNDGSATGDFMGTGQWVELNISNETIRSYGSYTFSNQADVLIHARIAGDAVGATKMDRPEWVAVHPTSGEVYVTLTNNSTRTTANDANPRTSNIYGQVVRWRETGGDAAATTFEWDIFVLAGNPTVPANQGTLKAGSSNVTADNTFNSPDGLGFDRFGRLWIQTDGKYTNSGDYANQGNNQMLAADPVSKEIRRFLVGPKECEVTGMTFTPDSKTMFINIQHPGESAAGKSAWPDGGTAMPRSATVIITKNDGGVIGS